jgi:TolA-binding protein
MYDAIIASNLASADYALYQKAIIAGAGNRTDEKIRLLQSLEQRYPASNLAADANMEIADTYLAEENFREAIAPLNKLLKSKKAASLHPQAYLKLGVAYFNLDDNTSALENLKTLVSTYPNSPESDAAVDYIRNIFVQNQRPSEFADFMRASGKSISYSEEDSITYASANMRYSNNDFNNALTGFRSYLEKFPNGRYALDASFNLANIYSDKKDYANAMIGYEYVATRAPNKYAEKAVLQAARIGFFELKDYDKAEQYFSQLKSLATEADIRLESMRGLLRSQYRLNKWKEAVPNAEDLLTQKGIATDDRMMAYMVIAKNYQKNNEVDRAVANYKTVVGLGKSEFGAEARYQLANILFQQGKLGDAEKAAFDVINKAGSYEYWTTRAYILLGDIYWKQKDYFNSEATFKSIAQNATIEELKEEAQVKLDAVIDDKNKESKVTN